MLSITDFNTTRGNHALIRTHIGIRENDLWIARAICTRMFGPHSFIAKKEVIKTFAEFPFQVAKKIPRSYTNPFRRCKALQFKQCVVTIRFPHSILP